jgi:hypothetical protein
MRPQKPSIDHHLTIVSSANIHMTYRFGHSHYHEDPNDPRYYSVILAPHEAGERFLEVLKTQPMTLYSFITSTTVNSHWVAFA